MFIIGIRKTLHSLGRNHTVFLWRRPACTTVYRTHRAELVVFGHIWVRGEISIPHPWNRRWLWRAQ